MEAAGDGDIHHKAARSSLLDSLMGCGLSGLRIHKAQLRLRILIPTYLRLALLGAIRSKDASYPVQGGIDVGEAPPEAPIVVFVNSKSGGRHGPVLKERLQELLSEEQVFDLSLVKPSEFVDYGLACLEKLAEGGDSCAKATREKLRVMVAGGDGTVGWVLGTFYKLYDQSRLPIPPVGIIPLGTGNDLSRSFDWGGSFPFMWRFAVKRSLFKAISAPVCRLDSWKIVVSVAAEETINPPHSLKKTEDSSSLQDIKIEGSLPDKVSSYEGVFYNYFSIGMDAHVAYGFHHLRNEKPYLARGPISNKLIYSGYSCTQGWFCTPCLSNPNLRGLRNTVRLHIIRKVECSDWEHIRIPSGVRALVALNLHSYGSGRNPWGHPKAGYLEKKGFVEAQVDDGLVEIFGLKQGWHASFVMGQLISAVHIAQAAALRLEIRGGQRKKTCMQMDGEPWKQHINSEYSTFVEIKKVPFPTIMMSGK